MRLDLLNKLAVVLILLFIGGALAVLTVPTAFAQETCPGSLPARLIIGQGGRVRPGGANNVRLNPTTAAERVGEIPSGETAIILEGPVCADGYTWWKVDYNGLNGWTPEGGDGEYWLEVIDLATGQPPIVIAQGDCEGSLPRRLAIGVQAQVRPRVPNNVRIVPALDGEIIGEIAAEGLFTVLNGPVCADGYTWWQVDYNGLIGWTAESGDGEYWLQVVDAPTLTPPPSATLPPATATPRPTERPLLYTVPDAFEDVVILPVWTEVFNTLEALSANPNSVGVYVNPIMDYAVNDGTLGLTYRGMIKPVEWERVIDTTVIEPMNQFVVSVDIQNLEPGDIYACAVIEINADAAHNARATFCRNNFMSLHYPRQLLTGNWEVRGPNAMDGKPHRLTLIADGSKMRLYVDGAGGVERPYTGTLESIGLAIEHGASGPDTISNVRFDNLEVGIPTNTLPSNPAITATLSPFTATVPPPSPTGSLTPTNEELSMLRYVVPATFAEVQTVPLWKTTFDSYPGGQETEAIAIYVDAQLTQQLDEDALSLSQTGKIEFDEALRRFANTTIDARSEELDQFIVSVDIQNLAPDSPSGCVTLTLNPDEDYRRPALFCRGGLVRMIPPEQPAIESTDPAYDAMDGEMHRLSMIADGRQIHLYIDGQKRLSVPYEGVLRDLGLGLYNPTAEADTISHVQFDNLEIGLPLACSMAVTLRVDEVKTVYTSGPYNGDNKTKERMEFSYKVGLPFHHHNPTDKLWQFTRNFEVLIGTRLTDFPAITRITSCDYDTSISVDLYVLDASNRFEGDSLYRVVTGNDLIEYPQTETVTFTPRGTPFEYEITYTIDIQPADYSIPLPNPDDVDNIQIDHSEEKSD